MTPTPFAGFVDRLLKKMDALVPPELYPVQVAQIPAEKIPGSAFFPGGSGLRGE
jgi:hypothetical protein